MDNINVTNKLTIITMSYTYLKQKQFNKIYSTIKQQVDKQFKLNNNK